MKQTVEEAALQLDQVEPNWFNMIDVNILNMGSICNCILGQVFGYDLDAPESILCAGGYSMNDCYEPPYGCNTDKNEWIHEIEQRKCQRNTN